MMLKQEKNTVNCGGCCGWSIGEKWEVFSYHSLGPGTFPANIMWRSKVEHKECFFTWEAS